jgi:penicillin-insensitive murein endopeptidase
LIQFVRWLGNTALAQGRSGILVGDLAQPRGGPMRSGHASHQSGLDVDVWFLPPPDWPLSATDRETLSAVAVVAPDGMTVGQDWTDGHLALLHAAASYPQVDRIFVNAAIKRELCERAGSDRAWLTKIRPWWGHDHHFHVRLACPGVDPTCTPQAPPPPGEGCDGELAWWFSKEARQMLTEKKLEPRKEITMADLPVQCEAAYHWSRMRSAAVGEERSRGRAGGDRADP